jgi:hypothetical protein
MLDVEGNQLKKTVINSGTDVLFRDNIKHHHTHVKTEAQPTVNLKDCSGQNCYGVYKGSVNVCTRKNCHRIEKKICKNNISKFIYTEIKQAVIGHVFVDVSKDLNASILRVYCTALLTLLLPHLILISEFVLSVLPSVK